MSRIIEVDVHIRDTTTGVTRVYRDDGREDDNGYFEDFIWEEGNFACDCNRAIFFAVAGGEARDLDRPCGDGRFVVEKIVRVSDGVTVYSEP